MNKGAIGWAIWGLVIAIAYVILLAAVAFNG